MRFLKIEESDIDATRVTLSLMREDNDAIVGRVTTLAINEDGQTELLSTAIADPPINQAIEFASQLAAFKEQDVDVFDPHGLWVPELGLLE